MKERKVRPAVFDAFDKKINESFPEAQRSCLHLIDLNYISWLGAKEAGKEYLAEHIAEQNQGYFK